MALVGYARCSTATQDDALQVEALKAAGCKRIFRETASGAQRDRPELAKALDYLRPNDVFCVWKLDRCSRSLKQLIETVELLGERGVGFRSLTENLDTTSPGGVLVFHIFGALAQFERELIRSRTIAGLEHARRMGRKGGRPRAMSEADIAKAKAMLAAPEITVDAVAETLGVSAATLYRYLPGGRHAL